MNFNRRLPSPSSELPVILDIQPSELYSGEVLFGKKGKKQKKKCCKKFKKGKRCKSCPLACLTRENFA